jgi:hypothetical protein
LSPSKNQGTEKPPPSKQKRNLAQKTPEKQAQKTPEKERPTQKMPEKRPEQRATGRDLQELPPPTTQ